MYHACYSTCNLKYFLNMHVVVFKGGFRGGDGGARGAEVPPPGL